MLWPQPTSIAGGTAQGKRNLLVRREGFSGVENELLVAAVALHLNRRIHSFAALNSWTGGSLTDLNSWTELYLNRRQRR